jgi:sensor c-di-GMP phosphodiesterase-like protein
MFRLNFLKIDKAFIKTIGSGAASAGLAQVIVDMARALGLTIIAEGVETRDQVDFLRQQGVHLAQGWYFSRPLPAPDFIAYIQKLKVKSHRAIDKGKPCDR